MRPFKDQSIADKALALSVVPTICALIVVVVASLVSTVIVARRNLVLDLEAQAEILSENAVAALAFRDRAAAADTVRTLRAKANIDAACLYDASGALFASYSTGRRACAAQDTAAAGSDSSAVRRTITQGARDVGHVEIYGNYVNLLAWTRRQAVVAAGALVAGLLIALLLTPRLRAAVSTPVIQLARTADRVSTSGDYSLRATRTTGDEVGQLVQSFNQMLDVIERTERERSALLQQTQETSRAKDEFLAAVSHELRTPLNAILGWLQILRTTSPSELTLSRALASLERNARAQARVIEDLIEVSRAASGKIQLRMDVVDLRTVVDAATDVISAGAAAKAIRVTTALPPEPLLVSGDRDRLQQIVWNVLANAVKFTPPSGSIAVAVEGSEKEYALSISDTGIGIAPDFLPRVFERFRQADGSMTREHGGLGLGLAIAKELTELHGGAITAVSAGKGLGSQFTIRLPRLLAASITEPRASLLPFPATDALGGVRLLAVDDDPDALEVVAAALGTAGATVTTAGRGEAAIDTWRARNFDLLLCDLAMPGIDGFEVLRQIRALNVASGRPTVAIALSAYASPEDVAKSVAAGFTTHVAKPFDVGTLVSAIAAALGESGNRVNE